METVKFGRTKVKIGDCVSVPNDYFGKGYLQYIINAGVQHDRIYGRVMGVIDGNRNFTVKWDFDQELTPSMSLEKVRYERNDTPLQVKPASIITTEDFEGMAGDLEQGSSTKAAETHALIVEEFGEALNDSTCEQNSSSSNKLYTLFIGNAKTRKDCLLGEFIPCSPGTLLHCKKLKENQSKFLITEVLNNTWDGFDADFHHSGTYVAWEKDHSEEVKTNLKETGAKKSNQKSRGKKSIGKSDGEKAMKDIKNDKKRKANADGNDLEEKTTKKKAKPRTTRKVVSKVIVGKKAADRIKVKGKSKKMSEEDNELDYEEDEEEDTDEKDETKRDEEARIWKNGGWKVDPRVRTIPGAHLIDPSAHLLNEDSFVEYFLTFFPVEYTKEVMLPATNKFATESGWQHNPFTYEEFINILGLLYMMEVVRLPERRMYWRKNPDGLFPALDFGKIMNLRRFEDFLNVWQLSYAEELDQQVLDFIEAVNCNLKKAMRAGDVLCLDESMIKAYHKGLNGKMKIIRKPRPIGNELKTVSDAKTHIVLHMELHEPKEVMAEKEFVKEYGATTACSLRLTDYWKGSGRIVVGDSWFGSVKTCVELWNINGLYSNLLVKTAHKKYPRILLREADIERGEWVCVTAEIDGVQLMATRFLDLQEKLFISSCSTSLNGPPRVTKYHGDVQRPMVAYDYLSSSASIDIHNHFRTGSMGLEDAWQTKNSNMRQVAGVIGFLFTNAYLAYRHFQKSQMKHCDFKVKLANGLTKFKEIVPRAKRFSIEEPTPDIPKVHILKLLPKPIKEHGEQTKSNNRYQKKCFYCQHHPNKAPEIHKTSWHCEACVGPNGQVYPLCEPKTNRNCFELHIIHGLPPKRRYLHK